MRKRSSRSGGEPRREPAEENRDRRAEPRVVRFLRWTRPRRGVHLLLRQAAVLIFCVRRADPCRRGVRDSPRLGASRLRAQISVRSSCRRPLYGAGGKELAGLRVGSDTDTRRGPLRRSNTATTLQPTESSRLGGVGAQLCPSGIATTTPWAFTVASRRRESTPAGSSRPAPASRCAPQPSPYPPDSSWWVD